MKRAWCTLLGAVALSVLLSGCGGEANSLEAGRALYDTGGSSQIPCATCHTLDGTDMVGPSFDGLSQTAAERVPGLSGEEYIRQSIINPSAHIVPGYSNSMPQAYARTLSEEEIDHLIAFLMEQ